MEEPKEIIEQWEVAKIKDVSFRLTHYYRDGIFRDVPEMFQDLKTMVHLLEKHVVKNEKYKSS